MSKDQTGTDWRKAFKSFRTQHRGIAAAIMFLTTLGIFSVVNQLMLLTGMPDTPTWTQQCLIAAVLTGLFSLA